MHLLIAVKQSLAKTHGRPHLTYGDCGELVLGKAGPLVINAFLLITQFGFCCVVGRRLAVGDLGGLWMPWPPPGVR